MFALFSSPGVDLVVERSWKSALVVAVAFLVWRLAVAAIDRLFARRLTARFVPRLATFSELFKSVAAALVLLCAVLAIASIQGIDETPEVWSAGVITAALAFGAQAVVRDVLAGLMFLFEDVYDVGDRVDVTSSVNTIISGTVESISLRLTVIADDGGRRVAIPNGNIVAVSNSSRLARTTALTLALPLRSAGIDAMRQMLLDVVRAAAPAEGIDVAGVSVRLDDLTADAAMFKIEFPTTGLRPAEQRAELRGKIAAAAQARGWLPTPRADEPAPARAE